MSMSEHHEQVTFVHWLKWAHPKVLFFAIPNGGYRNKITASKLKKEGVTAGVPDLFIAEPRFDISGLFIEMKTNKGVVSKSQKEIMTKLKCKGYCCKVAYGFDEARQITEAYLNE